MLLCNARSPERERRVVRWLRTSALSFASHVVIAGMQTIATLEKFSDRIFADYFTRRATIKSLVPGGISPAAARSAINISVRVMCSFIFLGEDVGKESRGPIQRFRPTYRHASVYGKRESCTGRGQPIPDLQLRAPLRWHADLAHDAESSLFCLSSALGSATP